MSDSEKHVERIELSQLEESESEDQAVTALTLELVEEVVLDLEAVIGHATVSIAELSTLKKGSIVSLDCLVDRPIDLVFEGQVVARGHLVAAQDHFGIQMTELPRFDVSVDS